MLNVIDKLLFTLNKTAHNFPISLLLIGSIHRWTNQSEHSDVLIPHPL